MAKVKAHSIILLAFLVLLGLIVSPVYAAETNMTYASTGGTLGNDKSTTDFVWLYVSSDTTNQWWDTLRWQSSHTCSQRIPAGTYDITVVCDGSQLIDGSLEAWNTPTGAWGTCSDGKTGYIEVDFDHQQPAFNYTGYCTMNGSFGGVYSYYFTASNSQDPASPTLPIRFHHYSNPGTNGMPYGLGYFIFDNTSPVSPPVANFACDNVYSNPSADITCTDLSSNTPTSWEFHSYYPNYTNYTEHTVDYTDSPWTLNLPDLGYYDVHLKVSNSAGSDWENKSEYIRIMLFPSWTATPTPSITAIPWTNLTTFNMTAYRLNITTSTIGNITSPFLDVIDGLYSVIEPAFIAVERILSWPFMLINQQFEQINDIYSETWATLISYTVIPLSITGRVVSAIPWEIQAIITMGIIFDIILLLIRGE